MEKSAMHHPDAHVLVIDDDPELQTLIRMLLRRAGIQTTSALTALEGRHLLEQSGFHLLVLDLMLPDMDGLELLKILRQDPQFADLPILVLSAKVDPETIARALALGANSYLTKPYVPRNLNHKVVNMLIQQRRQTLSSNDP
jgi:CheY-like chemotaxis protein